MQQDQVASLHQAEERRLFEAHGYEHTTVEQVAVTSASCTRLAAGSLPSSQASTAHESRHFVTGRVPLGDRF
jgi:hypothetical protein